MEPVAFSKTPDVLDVVVKPSIVLKFFIFYGNDINVRIPLGLLDKEWVLGVLKFSRYGDVHWAHVLISFVQPRVG